MYSFQVFIDGYNLIHQIPELKKALSKSIDSARDKLQQMVEAYCDYNNAKGFIVYDGTQSRRWEEGDNPILIYSKAGESADTVIESLVYKLDDRRKARVVTDDRQVSNMVFGMDAFTMSASSFAIEAKRAVENIRKELFSDDF